MDQYKHHGGPEHHGPEHHGPKHHGSGYKHMCFPFSPQDIHKMKHMAKHFMRSFIGGFGNHIPHNIEDIGDRYLITVPLAGRTKEDVKVSLINKNLNIKAEKPKRPEKENVKEKTQEDHKTQSCCSPFHGRGFTFIDVNMDIPLPDDANEDTIVSKMANGLLKITMDKKPAKTINIDGE